MVPFSGKGSKIGTKLKLNEKNGIVLQIIADSNIGYLGTFSTFFHKKIAIVMETTHFLIPFSGNGTRLGPKNLTFCIVVELM